MLLEPVLSNGEERAAKKTQPVAVAAASPKETETETETSPAPNAEA